MGGKDPNRQPQLAGLKMTPVGWVRMLKCDHCSHMGPIPVDRLIKKHGPNMLVATKLDRLGRNTIDMAQAVQRLADVGVKVHCLALGGVDLTSPADRMTMHVIGAVAQFERDLLIERTQAGLERAKASGDIWDIYSRLGAA